MKAFLTNGQELFQRNTWHRGFCKKGKSTEAIPERPAKEVMKECMKHLHLQGNSLSRVPDDFFQQFTNLVWLDLRYNRLTSLPSGIGAHRNLKSLLLEGNPIKALPVELGNLTTLKALNLRHCPLEFPPIEIVQKGLQNILLFLQNARVGKCNQVEPSLPEMSSKLRDEAKQIVKKYKRMAKKFELPSKAYMGAWKRRSFINMPPVEKLKLGELMRSSLDLSDEWPNEQEMKLFQSLKHRIMQSEKDECIQGLPYSIPGGQAEDSSSKIKDTKRISALSARKKSNLTDPSMYDVKIQNRRAEERKKTALTELKEKQAFLEQRKRDQEILNEWRKEAKIMQEKKEMKEKTSRFPPAIGDQVPISAPYATDHDRSHTKDSLENKKVHGSKQQERIRRVSLKSLKEFEQERTSRDIELDHRIKQHIQTMQEKRKQPALNEMRQAKEDLKTAERLQNELLQLKEEAPLEYRFTAFTGEISPTTTPRGQPQNIFSTTQFF
ncbi:leucine-rich repeat-containing protein 27 isoform X2 [Pleurodeles waltl]|uniref:leucine-rich repeat-containing protein 27 isoform X2 n=2 Tax=Pleurodeles waltl TaxID=8319 RepID=UPI003709A796